MSLVNTITSFNWPLAPEIDSRSSVPLEDAIIEALTTSTSEAAQAFLFNNLKTPIFQNEAFRIRFIQQLVQQGNRKVSEQIAKQIQLLDFKEEVSSYECAKIFIESDEWSLNALAKNLRYLPMNPKNMLEVVNRIAYAGLNSARALVESLHFLQLPPDPLFPLLRKVVSYGSYATASVITYLAQNESLPRPEMFALVQQATDDESEPVQDAIIKHLPEILGIADELRTIKFFPKACHAGTIRLLLKNIAKIKSAEGNSTLFWTQLKEALPRPNQIFICLFLTQVYSNFEEIPVGLTQSLNSLPNDSPQNQLHFFRVLQTLVEEKDEQEIKTILKFTTSRRFTPENFHKTLVKGVLLIKLEEEEASAEVVFDERVCQGRLLSILRKLLPCIQSDHDLDNFLHAFVFSRQPFALVIFLNNMLLLSGSDKDPILAALNTFVSEVINGIYHDRIFQKSPQLQKAFENHGELWKIWKKGTSVPLQAIAPTPGTSFSIPEFLRTKIAQGHLSAPRMIPALKCLSKSSSQLSMEDPLIVLLQLVSVSEVSTDEKIMSIFRYLRTTHSNTEKLFSDDLNDLAHKLQEYREVNYTGYTAGITHDPLDMLVCGSDSVGSSCQNVSGDPKYSKCLLDPMLDGKSQVVFVKDPSGDICARALLRVMWHSTLKGPVLFLEPIYESDRNLIPQIQLLARDFASKMKLPLYLPQSGYGVPPTDYLLECDASRAPYSYADSAPKEQFINRGSFSITHSVLA